MCPRALPWLCFLVFDLNFEYVDAEIIAVGSETLTAFRMDTNSLYLTEQPNLIDLSSGAPQL